MIEIAEMKESGLYELGRKIAEVAHERPDAVHRLILGMKHEFERQEFHPQLGELLWALWRHGQHKLDAKMLPIPFMSLNEVPSGDGHTKS